MSRIAGVVLAGGKGSRLGGVDKALLTLHGRTFLAHVRERAQPQVDALALSANSDPADYADFGLPVLADSPQGHVGPLAGLLSGLEWAMHAMPDADRVASFAVDTPFFPLDLVDRLRSALEREGAEIALAASGDRIHPVFGLWSVASAAALRHALTVEGVRAVRAWTDRFRVAVVSWDAKPFDPFFNINTPADLENLDGLGF